MSKMNCRNVVVITGGIACAFLGRPLQAAEVERVMGANATALCQSALPTFEGLIRKRPLAVQNEGSANAFITCSFLSQGSRKVKLAEIWVASSGGAPIEITCTGVYGFNGGVNFFVPKTVSVPSSGAAQFMYWSGSPDPNSTDNYFPSSYFSVSCAVPPTGALNQLQIVFDETVPDVP